MPEHPAHRSTMPDSELARVAHAAVLCLPGLGSAGRATFGGIAIDDLEWENWIHSVWSRFLIPFFQDSLPASRAGRIRELLLLDQWLHQQLSPESAERSIQQAEKLRRRVPPLQGEKILSRLWDAADRGESPGHLATFHSARCAAFSLPDRMARLTYLFAEALPATPARLSRLLAPKIQSAYVQGKNRQDMESPTNAFG